MWVDGGEGQDGKADEGKFVLYPGSDTVEYQ